MHSYQKEELFWQFQTKKVCEGEIRTDAGIYSKRLVPKTCAADSLALLPFRVWMKYS
jgi:hypothetical protein